MNKFIQISIAPFFLFFFCSTPTFANDPCEPLVVMALECVESWLISGSATHREDRVTDIVHWSETCEKTKQEWEKEFVACRTEHPLPDSDSEFLKLTPDPTSIPWEVSTFRLSDREQIWIYSKSRTVLKRLGESVQKFINEGETLGTSPKTVQRRQQYQMLKSLQSFQQSIEYQIEEQRRLRPPSRTEEWLKKQQERERLEEEAFSAFEEKLRSRLDEIYLKEESAIQEATDEILRRGSATPHQDGATTGLDEWKERTTGLYRDKKYTALYQEIDELEMEFRLMKGIDVPESILSLLHAKKEILSNYIHEVYFYQLAERLGIENPERHEEAVVQKLLTEISELRKVDPRFRGDDRAITILDTAEIALTASDSNFRENEKQLGFYWTNIGSTLIELNERAKAGLNLATLFIPFVNDARDFYELVTGKDLISGESIGASGKLFAVVGLLIGSGAIYRKIGNTLSKIASEQLKSVQDFLETVKKGEKIAIQGEKNFSELKKAVFLLRKYEIPVDGRRDIIESFGPQTKVIVQSTDRKVYRYVHEEGGIEKGYWYTDRLVSDPIEELSLRKSGQYTVKEWILPKGAETIEGPVAPRFGRKGGGLQIHVLDPKIMKERF